MEKALGKTKFVELLGDLVEKPQGKPTEATTHLRGAIFPIILDCVCQYHRSIKSHVECVAMTGCAIIICR